MVEEPLTVSVADARQHLGGCSVATIYRLLSSKRLDKRKCGSRTLITMRSIRSLIDASATSEAA